jgi:hypothetical protein
MTPMVRLLSGRVMLLALLAVFAPVASAQLPCDDFLAALHKKPNYLEFLGCKERTDLQGQPLQASYRVAGSHAADVESSLAKELGIKRLRRTCCVWESINNSYRSAQARLFVVSISTEETPIDSRDRWAEIPYFNVEVKQYREAP